MFSAGKIVLALCKKASSMPFFVNPIQKVPFFLIFGHFAGFPAVFP